MRYYILIFTILLSSCAAKKTITEKEYITKIDTLIITKDRTIVERFTDTLKIEQPCDSLGNLKPFKRTIVIPQGKIDIFNKDGNINAEIDLKAYEQLFESKYQKIYDQKLKDSKTEIIRNKIPFWIIIYSALITLICILLVRFR